MVAARGMGIIMAKLKYRSCYWFPQHDTPLRLLRSKV